MSFVTRALRHYFYFAFTLRAHNYQKTHEVIAFFYGKSADNPHDPRIRMNVLNKGLTGWLDANVNANMRDSFLPQTTN